MLGNLLTKAMAHTIFNQHIDHMGVMEFYGN